MPVMREFQENETYLYSLSYLSPICLYYYKLTMENIFCAAATLFHSFIKTLLRKVLFSRSLLSYKLL